MADPYRHLDPLATGDFSRLEELAALFERAWRADVPSDLASFCPPSGENLAPVREDAGFQQLLSSLPAP